MVRLWPRPFVFHMGRLPAPPREKEGDPSPLKLFDRSTLYSVRTQLLSKAGGNSGSPASRLTQSQWVQVATNFLKLSIDEAETYFDICENLQVDERLQMKEDNQEVVLVGELLLLMLVQGLKANHKQSPSKLDSHWPSDLQHIPALPTPRQLALQGRDQENDAILPYIRSNISLILDILCSTIHPGELSRTEFDVLGFLLSGGKDLYDESRPLSVLAPFWARDNDAFVPATEVEEWLSAYLTQNDMYNPSLPLLARSQFEGRYPQTSVQRATDRRPFVFSGLNKKTVLRMEGDLNGQDLKILNCHNTYVYVLSRVKNVSVHSCTNCTIVVGVSQHYASVDHCEKVKLITTCRGLRISNCLDGSFYVCTNTRPVLLGDNRGVSFAPYNTFYPNLEEHMGQAAVNPKISHWSNPVTDWVRDAQTTAYGLIAPDTFSLFSIPFKMNGPTKTNPCPLPPEYTVSVERKQKAFTVLRQAIKETKMDDMTQKELQAVIQNQFKEWLVVSGNLRQIQDLLHLDQQMNGGEAKEPVI